MLTAARVNLRVCVYVSVCRQAGCVMLTVHYGAVRSSEVIGFNLEQSCFHRGKKTPNTDNGCVYFPARLSELPSKCKSMGLFESAAR